MDGSVSTCSMPHFAHVFSVIEIPPLAFPLPAPLFGRSSGAALKARGVYCSTCPVVSLQKRGAPCKSPVMSGGLEANPSNKPPSGAVMSCLRQNVGTDSTFILLFMWRTQPS